MKGLLLKDMFTLTRQARTYILFIAVFSLLPGYNNTMAPFAVMMASMMPITALAYDERSNWDRLAVSMPYTTAQLVLSKYLLGLMLMLCAVVLSVVALPLQRAFAAGTTLDETLVTALGALCAGLLIQGVLLPAVFRFGTEKARMFMLVLMGTVFAGIALLSQATDSVRGALALVDGRAVLVCLAALAVAVYAVSMPLSIRAYARRHT